MEWQAWIPRWAAIYIIFQLHAKNISVTFKMFIIPIYIVYMKNNIVIMQSLSAIT